MPRCGGRRWQASGTLTLHCRVYCRQMFMGSRRASVTAHDEAHQTHARSQHSAALSNSKCIPPVLTSRHVRVNDEDHERAP